MFQLFPLCKGLWCNFFLLCVDISLVFPWTIELSKALCIALILVVNNNVARV